MANKQNLKNVSYFLNSPQFVEWRLYPSAELEEYWSLYIEQYPEQKEILNQAIKKFEEVVHLSPSALSEKKKSNLYERISASVESVENKKGRKKIYYYLLASVAIVAILLLTIPFNKFMVETEDYQALVIEELPSENIRLVVGDQVVEFDSNTTFEVSEKNGISTSNKEGSNVLFAEQKKEVRNTIIVPHGKQSVLVLADGTKLWLNAGTQVTFPTEFVGNRREINVVGEIYADVVSNPAKPFVVHTTNTSVQVHGTTFNVSDYGKDGYTEVVLVEGKVEVKSGEESVFLEPRDLYRKDMTGTAITHNVDLSHYISWKESLLVVHQKNVYDLFKYLERYYNVKFDNIEVVKKTKRTCTGKLFLSENLDDTMKALSVLAKIEYEQNGKTIYININN